MMTQYGSNFKGVPPMNGFQTSSQFVLTNSNQGLFLTNLGDSSISRVMQFHVKKRIKMSPREAVIRNSSCDDNTKTDQNLQVESELTMKVLLRH